MSILARAKQSKVKIKRKARQRKVMKKNETGVISIEKGNEKIELFISSYDPSTVGIVLDLTNDVPKILNSKQAEYLNVLTGHLILRDLKGELLNIIEGIGLTDHQETAVKRMITNSLHGWHRRFKDDINLVTNENNSEAI